MLCLQLPERGHCVTVLCLKLPERGHCVTVLCLKLLPLGLDVSKSLHQPAVLVTKVLVLQPICLSLPLELFKGAAQQRQPAP